LDFVHDITNPLLCQNEPAANLRSAEPNTPWLFPRSAGRRYVYADTSDVLYDTVSLGIILSIPTVLGSLYGMNVLLPGQDSPFTFAVIVVTSLGVSAAVLFYSWKRDWL
jgi:hypothetical protein